MPMKNMVDLKAVSAGAITGVASTVAQNIPGLGAYAPAVGLAVGGSFAGDASTKKTAHFLAGMSLGNALTGSAVPSAASPGGLL